MADQTDSFMRDVQEDMRRERMQRLWDRYGLLAILLVTAFVVTIGGYKFMEHRTAVAREAAGAEFEAAERLAAQGKREEAEKAFAAIAAKAPAGYATLARLRNAAALAEAGKVAEAVAAFEAVARDGGADQQLRDFATVKAALLRVDAADWTEMQNRLKDVTVDRNPWRATARELIGLAAMRAGREDDARKAFEQILGDRSSPPALLERTRTMMTVLTEAALAKAPPAAKASPTAPPPATAAPSPADGTKAAAPAKK